MALESRQGNKQIPLIGSFWCPWQDSNLAGGEGTLVEFGNGRGQMMLQVLSLVSRGKGA